MTYIGNPATPPPDVEDGGPIAIPTSFSYAPTIDGFEVIEDPTGRPLTQSFETAQQANGFAFLLNNLAKAGDRRGLNRALRSTGAEYAA
jgi:hypothetical protein